MLEFFKEMWEAAKYEHGFCATDTSAFTRARRNRFTGAIEFILWQPGEHGHKHPYWIEFDRLWWRNYVSVYDYRSMEELVRNRNERRDRKNKSV